MGKPHFELKDCLSCHKNPHTPKKIVFAGTVTDACTTCHTQQIAQLRENKSRHSALYCSTCHSVHREKPACTKCHKPHSADMPATDCNKCHKAHMPKNVMYSAETPAATCGACHKKALDLLKSSTAKHKNFTCAFCHPDKHKYVPKCQDCHGTPHPAGMHTKFPKCGDCHGIAHNVNHWSKTEAAPAAPEKKEPAPSKKKKQ
jgi:predicted CXXCH cytochrome family protein